MLIWDTFSRWPMPSGLRFCINAVALKKVKSDEKKITFGGGCFWCTEAMFQQLKGAKVESGYSGGEIINPTYREVCSEPPVTQKQLKLPTYLLKSALARLDKIHLTTHNPNNHK